MIKLLNYKNYAQDHKYYYFLTYDHDEYNFYLIIYLIHLNTTSIYYFINIIINYIFINNLILKNLFQILIIIIQTI